MSVGTGLLTELCFCVCGDVHLVAYRVLLFVYQIGDAVIYGETCMVYPSRGKRVCCSSSPLDYVSLSCKSFHTLSLCPYVSSKNVHNSAFAVGLSASEALMSMAMAWVWLACQWTCVCPCVSISKCGGVQCLLFVGPYTW